MLTSFHDGAEGRQEHKRGRGPPDLHNGTGRKSVDESCKTTVEAIEDDERGLEGRARVESNSNSEEERSVNIVPRWSGRATRDKLHDGGEIANEDEGEAEPLASTIEPEQSLYNRAEHEMRVKRPEEPIARIVESKSGNMKQDGNRGSAGVQAPRSS